jgi:hypothetical protein
MNGKAIRNALESITNVALLVVCAAILFLLVGGRAALVSRNAVQTWRAGDRFSAIPALDHVRNRETLVLMRPMNISRSTIISAESAQQRCSTSLLLATDRVRKTVFVDRWIATRSYLRRSRMLIMSSPKASILSRIALWVS